MSSKQARRYIVRGRVQGVGFRYFVEKVAGKLGCSGYVRNRPDNTVEVLAMGYTLDLDTLAEKLRRGPPLAQVDGVDETDAAPESSEGFQVRY